MLTAVLCSYTSGAGSQMMVRKIVRNLKVERWSETVYLTEQGHSMLFHEANIGTVHQGASQLSDVAFLWRANFASKKY